jgi:hypothetical protein
MPNMSWLTQADLDLPVCNEEMQPQDVAVVQFGIAQDGTVNAIQPIYSSRPGASGVAFARAIRDWQFARSAVADLNGFWRGSVRLELRCVARPAPQSIAQPFLGAASRWFLGQMVKFTPDGDLSAETTSAMQRANLAPLADLLGKAQKSAGKRDSTPYAAQIDAVLVTAHAPPAVRATFRDPIRLVATLHRSLIEKKMGDAAAAQDRLAKAGLDAQQCSLFDVRPVATNASISSSAFPDEALRWGMEGVARESFDIAADGKVTGIRTVLAYPPFVFADATERAVGRFRYIAPTLDGAALGCAGQSINVHFKVPK